MARNEALYRGVVREETARAQVAALERLTAQMKLVAQTEEGREVLDWIVFNVGCLMKPVEPADEGRRRVAVEVYKLLDRAMPGVAEEIALEARKRRREDDLNIAEAIHKRSAEYGE